MWRTLHAWAAILWVAVIIVQVFLAGEAIANLGGSGDFTTHIVFGYTIGILQLVVLILSSRRGCRVVTSGSLRGFSACTSSRPCCRA